MHTEYLTDAKAKEHLRTARDYCQLCQATPDVLHDQRLAVGAFVLFAHSLLPEQRHLVALEDVIDSCRYCSLHLNKSGYIAQAATRILDSNSTERTAIYSLDNL